MCLRLYRSLRSSSKVASHAFLVTVVLHDPKRYQSVVRGCVQHHSSSEGFHLPLPSPLPFHLPLSHPAQLLTLPLALSQLVSLSLPTISQPISSRLEPPFPKPRGASEPVPFPTSNSCPFSQLMIPSCPCPLVATLAPALLAATLVRALFDLLVDIGTYLLTHLLAYLLANLLAHLLTYSLTYFLTYLPRQDSFCLNICHSPAYATGFAGIAALPLVASMDCVHTKSQAHAACTRHRLRNLTIPIAPSGGSYRPLRPMVFRLALHLQHLLHLQHRLLHLHHLLLHP